MIAMRDVCRPKPTSPPRPKPKAIDRLVTVIDHTMHALLASAALFVIAQPAFWSYA